MKLGDSNESDGQPMSWILMGTHYHESLGSDKAVVDELYSDE